MLGSSGPSSALDESGSGSFLTGLRESVFGLNEKLNCSLSASKGSRAGNARLNLDTVGERSAEGGSSTSRFGASTC
jgi:hypothetical protein